VVVAVREARSSTGVAVEAAPDSDLDRYAVSLPPHTLDFTQVSSDANGASRSGTMHVVYTDAMHWRMETPGGGSVVFEQDGIHMLRYDENVVDVNEAQSFRPSSLCLRVCGEVS